MEEQLAAIGECTITTDLWISSHQQRSTFHLQFVLLMLTLRYILYAWSPTGPWCWVPSWCPLLHVTRLEDLRQNLLWDNRQWLGHCKCYWALGDCSHTLQLAIIKALQVPRVHNIIIARCKELVEHFKISSKDTYKLREKKHVMLQLPQHQLIQECPTRRGSTLSMLKRLAEQQAAIAAVLMEEKVYMMTGQLPRNL